MGHNSFPLVHSKRYKTLSTQVDTTLLFTQDIIFCLCRRTVLFSLLRNTSLVFTQGDKSLLFVQGNKNLTENTNAAEQCKWILLPHSAHLGISAQLKICQVSACKMGHEVVLFSEGSSQPATQPASQPATQPTNQPATQPPTLICV